MTKKGKYNRRKGRSLGEDDDDAVNGGAGEYLPEEYTIADSASNLSNFSLDDWEDSVTNTETADDYFLAGGKDRTDTARQAAEGRLLKLKETLGGLEDFTSEKRSARREASLRKLFKTLSQYATGPLASEICQESLESIKNACFYSIRVGSPSEQYAACRVLEVTSIVLGADHEEWCETVDRQLRHVVGAIHRATPVRAAALRALSATVFVGSSDSVTSEALMDFCEQVANQEFRNESVAPLLRATGLDCWALLATTCHDFDLAGEDDVQIGRGLGILKLLSECLDDTSIDLRSAAGECITLIHEARLDIGLMHDEGENTTERYVHHFLNCYVNYMSRTSLLIVQLYMFLKFIENTLVDHGKEHNGRKSWMIFNSRLQH
jgi:hypothetical protein